MKDDIKLLLSKGYLIEPSLASSLSNEPFTNVCITDVLIAIGPPKLITREYFEKNINSIIEKLTEKNIDKELLDTIRLSFSTLLEIKKQDEKKEDEIEKIGDLFNEKRNVLITGSYKHPVKKITVEDFVSYFINRYNVLKGVLQERELEGLCSIGKIPNQRRPISIIGLVSDKRFTKNKNMILEIEDLTGRIAVILNHERTELFEKAGQIVLDEVIAVKGFGSREIIFANDIFFPDIFLKEKKRASSEQYAAFTSDIHVGSDQFLEENFIKFINWINGQSGSIKQKEIAKKVKYLFIVGDTVHGVGVYPRQEYGLTIKDIRLQYKRLAELLGMIRKDITIIMCPGGKHDAVSFIEPQPPIPKEFASDLYEMENLILTTNPSTVRIAQSKNNPGFDVLMYHGDSYDNYQRDVDFLRLNHAHLKPDMIIHFLLRKRHLAPTHASTTYYPFEKDYLIIRDIPDIVVSGHMHKAAASHYNNILTISCSCWQSKTPYEEKFGHEPDPCKVPILNLKTGKISMLDFS